MKNKKRTHDIRNELLKELQEEPFSISPENLDWVKKELDSMWLNNLRNNEE